MRFDSTDSDEAVLKELGTRLARHRLNRNWTQAMLAEEAGVSRPTLARLEAGSSTNVSNLIRVLRALSLLENLECLVPDAAVSPIQQLRMKKQQRLRASSPGSGPRPRAPWNWGTEQ